jgi:AcrR family transcriptional regulator
MSEAIKIDGRIKRGEDNRKRISKAFLELLRAGVPSPTAELVAEKAGVGLRSVFRHFDDMETLFREIGEAIEAEVEPIWNVPFKGMTWQTRMGEMIERRSEVFERITPFRIASMIHRHTSRFLDQRQQRFSGEQRALLEAILPASILKDAARLEGLDLVLSIDSWLRLRREQNLDVTEAKAVIARLASALIGETIK